jgi:hypothetical protein
MGVERHTVPPQRNFIMISAALLKCSCPTVIGIAPLRAVKRDVE